MRTSGALAGAAVLIALLLSGCAHRTSGTPLDSGTDVSRPAAFTNTPAPAGMSAVAGDWLEDTTGTPTEVRVDAGGELTGSRSGEVLFQGRLMWLGENHYQILITSAGGNAPHVTADLGADGRTMTVHSSDEPAPVVYKRS